MTQKTVFCVGYRSATSGGFDWYKKSIDAANGFVEARNAYGSLNDDPHDIVRFDVSVPAHLSGADITDFIDENLDAHMNAAIKLGGEMVVSALQKVKA